MWPAVKSDGDHYYKYIRVYVGDILALSYNAKNVMDHIQSNFKFKDDKIEPPAIYLGAKL